MGLRLDCPSLEWLNRPIDLSCYVVTQLRFKIQVADSSKKYIIFNLMKIANFPWLKLICYGRWCKRYCFVSTMRLCNSQIMPWNKSKLIYVILVNNLLCEWNNIPNIGKPAKMRAKLQFQSFIEECYSFLLNDLYISFFLIKNISMTSKNSFLRTQYETKNVK